MTGNDAASLYPGMYPKGHRFVNGTPARIMLTYASYSPLRSASRVKCPLLVIVGDDDEITTPVPARKIAERAPHGTLLEFEGGHFDIYRGKVFDWAVAAERECLVTVLQSR